MMYLTCVILPMLANSLLRLALDGRISMYFIPPQFTKDKGSKYNYVSGLCGFKQIIG